MDIEVKTLAGGKAGTMALDDAVFGLTPRADILHRVVLWQLAKRQAGTHKTLGRSEINRTKSKAYRQKGTGRARHGAKSAPQFRGGGRAFGPVVRSHAHDLPKKVRALGLKHALSAKASEQQLIIVDTAIAEAPKTQALRETLAWLGASNILLIDAVEIDRNLGLAVRNLPRVDVLPLAGINVYDILRREKLVLTRAAVEALKERFAAREAE
jgi:large subunit ribosomal protein L4